MRHIIELIVQLYRERKSNTLDLSNTKLYLDSFHAYFNLIKCNTHINPPDLINIKNESKLRLYKVVVDYINTHIITISNIDSNLNQLLQNMFNIELTNNDCTEIPCIIFTDQSILEKNINLKLTTFNKFGDIEIFINQWSKGLNQTLELIAAGQWSSHDNFVDNEFLNSMSKEYLDAAIDKFYYAPFDSSNYILSPYFVRVLTANALMIEYHYNHTISTEELDNEELLENIVDSGDFLKYMPPVIEGRFFELNKIIGYQMISSFSQNSRFGSLVDPNLNVYDGMPVNVIDVEHKMDYILNYISKSQFNSLMNMRRLSILYKKYEDYCGKELRIRREKEEHKNLLKRDEVFGCTISGGRNIENTDDFPDIV